MKRQFNAILNAIGSEVEYQTTSSDYQSDLLACLLADDIAYNAPHYRETLTNQLTELDADKIPAMVDWLIDEWLPNNGDLLEHRYCSNYWAPANALLVCPVDEITIDFDAYGIDRPSELLINYINKTTDFYCTRDQISLYCGGDSNVFTLSNDTLKEAVASYE